MITLVTAKEALQLGEKYYFTGNPCKNGHISKRLVSGRQCTECAIINATAWRKENPERFRAAVKKSYYKNYENEIKRAAIYRTINRDKCILANKNYRAANPHKYAIMNRYNVSKRLTAKLQRTPKWVDLEIEGVIKEIYELATVRTKLFGFSWHVDHIIPLQGKLVSGLHVPENLQVIPAIENMRKLNTFRIS